MAENSLGVKTDEIYERRNEKGKEMQNYQDAEKQLLAIQAAQQQNLNAARTSNLAQYQNNQNLAAAGDVLNQTQQANTQQVTVNPTTQQILQKYGATKPGTITKTTHSQQVTKQNITINNNTTTTTNNQVSTPPPQPQVVRPQRDNSSEKFKIWLNNTLARQQEDYARREKDYDKRESALTRDSNKMLRKLGEFSKDMMEKMDPRRIGSTATSQIKTLLFMFGFQYLASNWTKILKTVASIEGSFKRGLAYFGLYNLKSNGSGSFCFKPGESQFALDIYGLFSGNWKVSSLLPAGSSGGNSGITPLMGGENGFVGGLRKVLLGDQAVGGKDKGLIEIMKEFFVNQGKKRMAAAKMIEKPDFNVGSIEGTLRNLGDYLGQLLSVFLGDPEEAIRSNIVSRMSINSAHQSWNKIKNLSTGDTKKIYTTTDNKTHEVEQGIMAYTRGKQRGLSLRSIDSSGNLISGDAESSYSQSDDLALALEDAQEGDELDAGRLATGFHRLYQAALSDKRGVVPVSPEFLNKFIPKAEDRDRLLKSGDMKYTKYNYVIRKVKATDDTGVAKQDHWYDNDNVTDSIWWGLTGTEYFEKATEWGHELVDWLRKEETTGKEEERLVLVPEGNERPSDLVTESSEMLYELTPNALNQIVNKYRADDQHVEIDLSNENYFNAISDFAARESRTAEEKRDPDKFRKTYNVNYRDSQGNGTASLNYDEYQIYKNKKVYTGSDKRFAKYVNESLYNSKVKQSEDIFKDSFLQGNVNGSQVNGGLSAAAIANKTLDGLSFKSIAPGLSDFGNSYTTFGTANAGNPFLGEEQDKAYGSILSGLDNKMIAVNPANPEEKIDFSKLDLNMTSKEATDLFNKVKNWNFNSDNDASKLVKAKDSDLKKRVINFLGEALLGKGYPGIYMANDQGYYKRYKEELSEILSDPNLFDDPSSRTKLKELLSKYALVENDPRTSQLGERKGRSKEDKENDFNESVKRRVTGESHINEIFGVYDNIVSIIDAKLDATRKESLLNQLGIFIQNKQDAEAELKKVNNQITTYNTDYTQRVIAADGIDAEYTSMYKDNFGGLNQWKDEVNQNNQQFSEDVQNNSVTKKASDVLDTLSGYLDGVKETFDDYSSEAKSWFGERFNNAKDVVNDFLRNLDYTKVSLAKYPNNTLIDRSKKLLIWHCFNNPSSNDVYDFIIHDAAGRFGAGRNDSKPWTRLHEGRTTFDRIHAGQDISEFLLNGSPLSGKVSPTLFAPFNCVVMSYRNDYEKSGKNVIIRQTGGDSEKTKYGRFGIAVCHLDSITDDVKKAYRARVNKTGERIILEKGTALGIMGGSGHSERWHYDPHFHVNVLDYDNTGPFDGPFTKPLKGVSPSFRGFHGNGFNEHAVDPLFVYVDDDGDVSNETFYLSSDRKVVTVDEASADKKQFNKDNLYDGELSVKDKEENSEENPDNENGEEKDNRPFLEKAWDWLKDMAFKVKMEYLNPSLDSLKSSKEDFLKLKQGQVGMSFAKSSYSYSGQVTPEFVNYQNYLKNAGKIGLGPDGQPLSEAEWRNQVFDMTGSDPVALKLGEYLNHGVAVKSASQLSNKDTKETISKYSETNNTENTVNNVEGSTGNGEVSNVAITNSMEEGDNNTIVGDVVKFIPNTDGFFGNKTLTDLQNEGKPFYNLEKKGDLTNERLLQINKILLNNREFMAKISDTVLAAFDRQAGLTVAGMGNKKPNVTVANTVTGTGSSNVN